MHISDSDQRIWTTAWIAGATTMHITGHINSFGCRIRIFITGQPKRYTSAVPIGPERNLNFHKVNVKSMHTRICTNQSRQAKLGGQSKVEVPHAHPALQLSTHASTTHGSLEYIYM